MELIKTGNYRVGRQKMGGGGTLEIIFVTTSLRDAKNYLKTASLDTTYDDYFIEEEVYTKGSFIDKHGNPIDSAPYWRRVQ